MTPTNGPPVRTPRAFALPELLAILAVAAVLMAALAVAGEGSRRTARLGDDLAKLRFIGAATGSYAADHADHVWSFSWQGRVRNPLGMTPASDLDAAAQQAIYLLRNRTGRTDLIVPNAWMPYFLYNHLVLVEYLDASLPDSTFVSSGDTHRQDWANDPACFDQGCFLPYQPDPTPLNSRRWPYSASFSIPAAFWDQSPVGLRVRQASQHAYYTPGGADLRPVLLSSVAFPSQKVFLHDNSAWHFGQRAVYATHDEARLPLLFADGSARVKAAADSNPGWHPDMPHDPLRHTMFIYAPYPWEPPVPPGSDTLLIGRFRWTRGGILGRDFGGAEIDTNP